MQLRDGGQGVERAQSGPTDRDTEQAASASVERLIAFYTVASTSSKIPNAGREEKSLVLNHPSIVQCKFEYLVIQYELVNLYAF